MNRLNKLAEKIRKNDFEAVVFDTKEKAKDYIIKLCLNKSVGTADSHTIRDMNLLEALQNQNNELYSCLLDKGRENKLKTLTTDVFILSVNAISEETGEMVNVDSSCNRVAGSLYGPKEIVFIVGKNKIADNLSLAMDRARNVAAPINSKIHNYKTPCVVTGKCENCSSPDRICRTTVIYHKKPKPMKSTVILINENLGF